MFLPDATPTASKYLKHLIWPHWSKDYKGRAAVAQGEAFDASPANIDGRTKRVEVAQYHRNGTAAKINAGQRSERPMTLRYGDAKSLMNKAAHAVFTADAHKGTTTRTRQQIKDEFDRLKAQVKRIWRRHQVMQLIKTTKRTYPLY